MYNAHLWCLEEIWVVGCAKTGVGVILCRIIGTIRQKMAQNRHIGQILKWCHISTCGLWLRLWLVWRLQLDWTFCVDTKKIISRETERTKTDLNIRMKSSRRGASNCVSLKKFRSFFIYFLRRTLQKRYNILTRTIVCASLRAFHPYIQIRLSPLGLAAN